jgi:hypothetical protein
MFRDCKLDAPSVKNIALTINKKLKNVPRFEIGVDKNIVNDEQVKKDLGLIKYKGWDVYRNGSNVDTTYAFPKYAECTNLADVNARDESYKTTDIVNGSWTEHLPDLLNGTEMFNGCSNLTTFNADLSSLTDGARMFYDCDSLKTFNSDLSSLTEGDNMFWGCKLNAESIQYIADNINDLEGETSLIHIGHASDVLPSVL